MPAYVVANVKVVNPDAYAEYSKQVAATLEPFQGRFIARGGRTSKKEGDWHDRVVVIEFPSLEAAEGWYSSPAYQAVLPIRLRNAESRVTIVEGVQAAP